MTSRNYDDMQRITPTQCKAARALLGWNQQELAQRAKIGSSTVADFERGKRDPVSANLDSIVGTFEGAGIQFVAGGVQGAMPFAYGSGILPSGGPIRLIDSTDLSQWAARVDAKQTFPELIERLILATISNQPRRLQFPSGDSVQQAGWDGICEQDICKDSAWLPSGASGWELGTQRANTKSKAEGDYSKRVSDPLGLPIKQTSFVFATLQLWKDGGKWAQAKRAEKKWRDVRVLDADDLVAWIAMFPAVAYWLAARIGKHIPGTTPLEEFWREWRLSTEWPMSTALVLGGRDDEAIETLKWLYGVPTVRSTQTDSTAESMAFLYAAIDLLPEQYRKLYQSRCLVASSAESARALGNSPSPLTIVMEASEPGLAARLVQQGHHVLVTYGSQVGTTDLVTVLSRPTFEAFKEALEQMGLPDSRAKALTRDSARKLAILRRLVPSAAGAIPPAWAEGAKGRSLVPALLAGAWDENSEGDREILELLSGEQFAVFSSRCTQLFDFPDAPLRRAGKTWKLSSPYDAWFRLAGLITQQDLERFTEAAQTMLGAIDPRFEMASDERWYAGIRGQLPKYSALLMSGITEALLLLAMYGDQVRAVSNASQYANRIVSGLLGTADASRWWSLSDELQTLAEISPDTFLNAVDDSLARDNQPIMVLFKEDGGPLLGRAYHSNLLWALETLAWSPNYLSRVSLILARLATIDPGGSYSNRPQNSLRSIFLLWIPQTNADSIQRLKVIDLMRKAVPSAAWSLMLSIFPKGYDTSTFNPKPKWRDFEVAKPEIITHRSIHEAAHELATRLIADAGLEAERWKELIEHLAGFAPDWRKSAWKELGKIANSLQGDDQKVIIWAALRRLISHHRSFPDAEWALPEKEMVRIEKLYHQFTPVDPVRQRLWLFSYETPLLQGRPIDQWDVREKEVDDLRTRAVREILELPNSFESLRRLTTEAKVPRIVGLAYVRATTSPEEVAQIVTSFINDDSSAIQEFVHGLIAAGNFQHGQQWAEGMVVTAETQRWSTASAVTLLLALPPVRFVWDFAVRLGDDVRRAYWTRANFFPVNEDADDTLYAIQQLLEAHRGPEIVERIAGSLKGIPASTIIEVLEAAARSAWPTGGNDAVMFQWGVGELLKRLEADPTVEEAAVARLEWMYLAVLEHSERSPIVLHRYMATNAAFFVEVLSAIYRARSEDPSNEHHDPKPEATEHERAMAFQASRLLQSWKSMPGVQGADVNDEELISWVKEAHRLAVAAERGAVGDQYIGRILAFAPQGNDGTWPHAAVREVIESMRNAELENGILLGLHNKRGVTTRLPLDGGAQERSIAASYRKWSDDLQIEWPRTSSLLRRIAESFESDARHHDEQAERTDWQY